MDSATILQARLASTRFLTGHYPLTPHQAFEEMAQATEPGEQRDHYGQGAIINDFEAQIAQLLGKEAAVFMPTGVMSQQIALRLHAERTHNPRVALHPTSHLEGHEDQAYRVLHALQGVLACPAERMLRLADLEALPETVGALLLELPQREIGGQLPAWDELVAMTAWARANGIALHLDGARLWESQPYYARELPEIAALFDTVYVSFYKTIGGIAGAALAGPKELIKAARVWQRRHGGNLISLYPYVVSARLNLAKRLPRIPAYVAKAQEIAAALSALPQITLVPNRPVTNMFHVYLRGDGERLLEAATALAQETRTFLFGGLAPTIIPDLHKWEFVAGDATLDIPTAEIRELLGAVVERGSEGGYAGE